MKLRLLLNGDANCKSQPLDVGGNKPAIATRFGNSSHGMSLSLLRRALYRYTTTWLVSIMELNAIVNPSLMCASRVVARGGGGGGV